jgi:hypothetical protein
MKESNRVIKVSDWINPDFPDSLVKALWPRPEQGFDSLAPDRSLAVVENFDVVEDRQPCHLAAKVWWDVRIFSGIGIVVA